MFNSIDYYTGILEIVNIVTILGIFVSILIALKNKVYWNKPLKIIYYFLLSQLIIVIVLRIIYWAFGFFREYFIPILKKLKIIDMSFMSIFAQLSIFLFIGLYFTFIIQNNKISKLINKVYIFFILTILINYLFLEGFNVQSVYNSTCAAMFCFFLSSLHLWYLYNDVYNKVTITKNSYYWIDLGLLLPNIMTLLMYFIGKKLEETDRTMFLFSNIVCDIIQLIGYLLFAIGFYYARYTKYMPKATT